MQETVRIRPEIGQIKKSVRAQKGMLVYGKLPDEVRKHASRLFMASREELMKMLMTNIENQLALTRALQEQVRRATEEAKAKEKKAQEVERFRRIAEKGKIVREEVIGPEEFKEIVRPLPVRVEREAQNLLNKVERLRRPITPLSIQAEIKFYRTHSENLLRDIAKLRGLAEEAGIRIEGTIVEHAIRAAQYLAEEFARRAMEKQKVLERRRASTEEEEVR